MPKTQPEKRQESKQPKGKRAKLEKSAKGMKTMNCFFKPKWGVSLITVLSLNPSQFSHSIHQSLSYHPLLKATQNKHAHH